LRNATNPDVPRKTRKKKPSMDPSGRGQLECAEKKEGEINEQRHDQHLETGKRSGKGKAKKL